ncbi:MAG: hypothetical protein FJZ61_06250 [Chlamydiae bacterium]|nr:hypothetical protein [Chlamydiota bacterium]
MKIFLFLCFFPLFSATLSIDPIQHKLHVWGSVPLTKGVEPILFHYSAIEPFPHLFLEVNANLTEAAFKDTSGGFWKFKRSNKKNTFYLDPDTIKGLSNYGSDYTSRTNPSSLKVECTKHSEVIVRLQEGRERIYTLEKQINESPFDKNRFYLLLLREETLPSGMKLLYFYDDGKLKEISLWDPKKTLLIDRVDILHKGNVLEARVYDQERVFFKQNPSGYELHILGLFEERFVEPMEEMPGYYENRKGDWRGFSIFDHRIVETYLKDQEGKEFLHEVYKRGIYENVNLVEDSIGICKITEHDGYRVQKNHTLERKKFQFILQEIEDKHNYFFSSSKEVFLDRTQRDSVETNEFLYHPTLPLIEKKFLFAKGRLLQAQVFVYDALDLIRTELYQDLEMKPISTFEWDPVKKRILGQEPALRIEQEYANIEGVCRLVKRAQSNGIEEHFSYLEGQAAQVALYLNGVLTKRQKFIYDSCRRLEHFFDTDPTAGIEKSVSYTYNSIGQILTTTYKSPSRTLSSVSCTYDSRFNKILETELDGLNEIQKTTSHIYDEHDRKVLTLDNFGFGTATIYDSFSRVTRQRDLLTGVDTTYGYDIRGSLVTTSSLRGEEKISYDRFKRPVRCEDIFGGVRTQIWDCFSKIISLTLPECRGKRGVITYKYDALGYLKEETDPLGHCIKYKNDLLGNKTFVQMEGLRGFYSYNPQGLMTEKRILGQMARKEIHDPLGRVIEAYKNGKKTTYCYNGFDITEEHRFDGTDIFYTYDDAGRLIQETTVKGGGKMTKRTEYDAAQNPAKVQFLEKGQTIQRVFDKKNRVIDEVITGVGNEILSHKKQAYSRFGHITEIHLLIDGKWAVTRKECDIWGREILSVDPLGNATIYTYQDKVPFSGTLMEKKTKLSPCGTKEITYTDPMGLPAALFLFDPKDTLIKKEIYQRDLKGNLVELELVYQTMEGEKKWHMECTYDAASHLLKKTYDARSPHPQVTTFTYDEKGRLTTLKKPSSTLIYYSYRDSDEMERVFSSDGTVDYKYIYDEKGRLIEVKNGVSQKSTRYSYCDEGLLLEEVLENGTWVKMGYDSNMDLESLDFSHAGSVFYKRGPLGITEVVRESFQKGAIAFKIHKTEGGNGVKQIDLPFSIDPFRYAYDVDGRVILKSDLSGIDRIQKKDLMGSAIARGGKDIAGPFLVEYSYDFHDQLESSTDGEINKVYNGIGIPDFFKENKVLADTKLQIRNLDKRFFQYDPRGNLSFLKNGEDSISYTYDAFDRLVKADLKNKKILFSYDHKNRLVQKIVQSKTIEEITDYLYQDAIEVGSVDPKKGVLNEFRTILPSKKESAPFTLLIETPEKILLVCHDIFQNLIGQYNPIEKKWESFSRFTPFGTKNLSQGQKQPAWSYKESRWDDDLKLFIFGVRLYDPSTHQFITRDPLGEKYSFYQHQFCLNNPLKYDDPSGLAPIDSVSLDLSQFITTLLNHMYEGRELSWTNLIGTIRGEVFFPLEEFSRSLASTGSYWAKSLYSFIQKVRSPIDKRLHKSFREAHNGMCSRPLGFRPLLLQLVHPLVHRIEPDFVAPHDPMDATYEFFTNGVNNSLEDAKKSALSIANGLSKEVYLVYNTSVFLFYDICRAAKNMISRAKGEVAELLNKVAHATLEEPTRKVRVWAHSEGALNASLAFEHFPEDKKDRLSLITYGGAEWIPACYGGVVLNFVTDKDAISLGINSHILSRHSREWNLVSLSYPVNPHSQYVQKLSCAKGHFYNVIFIESSKKTFDHSFCDESYQFGIHLGGNLGSAG